MPSGLTTPMGDDQNNPKAMHELKTSEMTESVVRSIGLVGMPSVTPLVKCGRCNHEWIKQPDGSYACWKCGDEKPAGSVEDRHPNDPSSAYDYPRR
jgi:hypothetical protein